MTLVARIAALSLLTSVLVAALGLAVLSAFVDRRVPSGEFVIPGLVLACVGGIIGAIAGTAREIVAARGGPQPQTTGLSTATKRRTPLVAAALVFCFLCVVVVWFKVRSYANAERDFATEVVVAREAAAGEASLDEPAQRIPQPTVKPGTATLDSVKPAPAKSDAVADAMMPDISGRWTNEVTSLPVPETPDLAIGVTVNDGTGAVKGSLTLKDAQFAFDVTYVATRSQEPGVDFEFLEEGEPEEGETKAEAERLKWLPGTRRFQLIPRDKSAKGQSTYELSADGKTLGLRVTVDDAEKERLAAEGGITVDEMERLLNANFRRLGPNDAVKPPRLKRTSSKFTPGEDSEIKLSKITGTWSRAESGTFSKLTIWPVENRELMIFVEGEDANGLLEWKPATANFAGFFAFKLLGERTTQAVLAPQGPNGTKHLTIIPFEDQRKQLLRSGFAKTERELGQKLSASWTRVAAPAQPQPVPTVTVVKTEFKPAPVRDALRAKYREPPYRFFSNDTFQSVIAIAPEEAQEEIEVLIHKLDVKASDDSFDLAGLPNIAQAVPANPPLPASRRPDQVVPDITGTWRVAIWYQEKGKYEPVEAGVMEIRRVGAESFLIDQPWVEKATRIFVEWSDANRRFQGIWGNDEGHSKITLQPASDNNTTLRVVVTKTSTPKGPLKKGGNEQGSEEKSSPQQWPQEWTRVSWTLSTTQENHIDLTGAAPDTVSHGTIPTRVVTPTAIPDTPAAKRLVEQLAAQESAAADRAARIRKLQANGQAEQDRQLIAGHQTELKHLLSTAFDLKLQLEELQVQELQSRLSRLERQIGQRKELREKIINRRAGELIEGDALRWDSTAPGTTKLPVSAVGNTKKAATPEVIAILRERVDLLMNNEMRSGNAKPDAVLRAINELAQAEPPEAHPQYVERLKVLVEFSRQLVGAGTDNISKAELLEIEAAYEKARLNDSTKKSSDSNDALKSDSATSKPNASQSNPVATSVLSTQINFTGPKGMEVTIAGEPWELIAPGRHNFVRHTSKTLRYDLGFIKAPGAPDRQFAALLDIYPSTTETHQHFAGSLLPATDGFLRHNSVPITITEADTQRASSELLIKVVCLSKTSSVEAAIPEIKTFDSTNITRGLDVIGTAPQFGTILAVLRLAANADQLGKLEPKSSTTSVTSPRPASQPDPLPSPEELKAKLKPFADPLKAAMQRVRDLEPTFFQDRSNVKEMRQAMQELAQARIALKPAVKEVEAIFDELNTEYELAELTAKALESRVSVLAEKLSQGEATEAEVRAAMSAHRNSPRVKASLEARSEKYVAAVADIADLATEDEALPPSNAKRTGPQPTYHPAFAMAWLETALQAKVEFVSLAGLDLPFKAALRVKETHDDLQAGNLIVSLNGEPFETLDQAVTSSNVAKKRDSSDPSYLTMLKGGLSGQRLNGSLNVGRKEDCLNPTAPTSEWYRIEVKIRRGETIESEYITGTCVGPDGLVVIPIASNVLAPNEPIVSYGGPEVTVKIVGSDDRHGLTLLKLSGPVRQWVKCRASPPKLEQTLGYFHGASRSECVVTSIGLPYPKPLAGDDAFQIKHSEENQSLERGEKLVTPENELQGLILEPLKDPTDKKNSYHSALVVPAVHIQKLIDEYREKSLNQKPASQSLSQPPKADAPSNAE